MIFIVVGIALDLSKTLYWILHCCKELRWAAAQAPPPAPLRAGLRFVLAQ